MKKTISFLLSAAIAGFPGPWTATAFAGASRAAPSGEADLAPPSPAVGQAGALGSLSPLEPAAINPGLAPLESAVGPTGLLPAVPAQAAAAQAAAAEPVAAPSPAAPASEATQRALGEAVAAAAETPKGENAPGVLPGLARFSEKLTGGKTASPAAAPEAELRRTWDIDTGAKKAFSEPVVAAQAPGPHGSGLAYPSARPSRLKALTGLAAAALVLGAPAQALAGSAAATAASWAPHLPALGWGWLLAAPLVIQPVVKAIQAARRSGIRKRAAVGWSALAAASIGALVFGGNFLMSLNPAVWLALSAAVMLLSTLGRLKTVAPDKRRLMLMTTLISLPLLLWQSAYRIPADQAAVVQWRGGAVQGQAITPGQGALPSGWAVSVPGLQKVSLYDTRPQTTEDRFVIDAAQLKIALPGHGPDAPAMRLSALLGDAKLTWRVDVRRLAEIHARVESGVPGPAGASSRPAKPLSDQIPNENTRKVYQQIVVGYLQARLDAAMRQAFSGREDLSNPEMISAAMKALSSIDKSLTDDLYRDYGIDITVAEVGGGWQTARN